MGGSQGNSKWYGNFEGLWAVVDQNIRKSFESHTDICQPNTSSAYLPSSECTKGSQFTLTEGKQDGPVPGE